ncbi:MAG: S8 family serine peptidase, partial [Acidobacteriaceae bacterium]|nr:S8 family serine peptidase [Acidobacteriaceae bacterium]
MFGAQSDRITREIDRNQSVALRGHVNAHVRPEFDRGKVDANFALPSVTIRLKRSATQQSTIEQLLADQQNPGSAQYHRWLTPEQYADQFGLNASDLAKVTGWLESSGFKITYTARARNYVTFSATAAQVQSALGTEIHRYNVNGELHYANATDPVIPAALADVVHSFHGLTDFRWKPRLRKQSAIPEITSSGGAHYLGPDDLATIYDIAQLYQAGVDGTGQKLAIMGQTGIRMADITNFRTHFKLAAMNLQLMLVPGQTDPGVTGDLDEADLDLEWSGAVARNATILYVYAGDINTSLTYAIDQNLAPVISASYGGCEGFDLVDLPSTQTLAQQANVQGITWVNASGDAGAADCDTGSVAQAGLAVDSPASTPEVTAVGGTEFVDQGGSYWASTNTSTLGSALSYIPEKVWNDSIADGELGAGGGGVSSIFARPVWQSGPGVPNDGFRHVPDVAMAGSADHDGYYVYSGGSAGYFGGTSAGTPVVAGILTLLNQYLVSTGAQSQPGLGNVNPMLYRMAQTNPNAFHDVSMGDNKVPCNAGAPDCTSNGNLGYSAAPGYDMASGLGSLDAYNLVQQWSNQAPQASAVVASIDQNPVFKLSTPDANGHSWAFVLTLSEEAGIPTTLTSLTMNGQVLDIQSVFGTTKIPARGQISSTNLGLSTLTVPSNVVFAFSGVDASGRTWSEQYAVPFQGVEQPVTVGGASNAASGQQVYAPGMIMSLYGSQFTTTAASATATPLPTYLTGLEGDINGVSVPLYYVGPNQVNLQIPYETAPGRVTLTIGNPYVNAVYKFQVASAAPGIFQSNGFVAAPFNTVKRGSTTTLFITGDGVVRPSLATGSSPAAGTAVGRLPKPIQSVTVTVAGMPATVEFYGIPVGLVGVTQINYDVPANAPLGNQQVVVTVGTVSSPPANVN